MKPLALDLCCGLGGWAHGLLAEGWNVIGYDIERHEYGGEHYPAQLVLQDILTLDGRQFNGRVSLIVASPPCIEFSYMAMPWKRGKQIAAALRGKAEFPKGYKGSRTIPELTALFDACVRIGREAECPTIIENVRGAQPWIGKARWAWGSFYLWGDVPALMPITQPSRKMGPSPGQVWKDRPPSLAAHREQTGLKLPGNNSSRKWADREVQRLCDATGYKSQGMNWSDQTKKGQDFTRLAGQHCGMKNSGGSWFAIGGPGQKVTGQNPDGRKLPQDGHERDHPNAFGWKKPGTSSKSSARKAASAMIAKIHLPLALWIAKVFKPRL